MQIQEIFKNYSKTKIKVSKELKSNIQSACVNAQERHNTENKTFLGISGVFLHDFLLLSFGHFFKLFVVLLIVVNEVKHSRISWSVINFQGNFSFQGVSSALEMTFPSPALFKEIKGLHERCTKHDLNAKC